PPTTRGTSRRPRPPSSTSWPCSWSEPSKVARPHGSCIRTRVRLASRSPNGPLPRGRMRGLLPHQATLDLAVPLSEVTFCAVDLETTGGSPRDSAITEVGAVKCRGGECLGTLSTLVDPGTP